MTAAPALLSDDARLAGLVARQAAGWSLEQPFYTDGAVFDLDLERIWHRQWLFAGHGNAIGKPGDYFLLPVGGESLIIVRDHQGFVHALFNTCRHRGSRICTQPAGNARSLVCPYHQWVYAHDGSLLSARLMAAEFDKARFGLRCAHAREVEGLLFICLAEEPPEFAAFEELIAPRLRPHALPAARIAHTAEYEIGANWKLVVENSRECYHCGTGHPQYCRAVGFAAGIGSHALAEADVELQRQRHSELADAGIDLDAVSFESAGWFHFRRFFLRDGMRTESMDGEPIAPLMGTVPGYESGVFAIVTLPNSLLEASPDYVMTLALFPISPTRTRARVTWLVRGDAQEGEHYEIERLTEFWRLTSEQDWKLCEDNQAGVNSRFYMPGPYAPDERGVEHFVRWYLKSLA